MEEYPLHILHEVPRILFPGKHSLIFALRLVRKSTHRQSSSYGMRSGNFCVCLMTGSPARGGQFFLLLNPFFENQFFCHKTDTNKDEVKI